MFERYTLVNRYNEKINIEKRPFPTHLAIRNNPLSVYP